MQTTLRGQFSGALIQQLERLFRHGTAIGLTEGELLDRFVPVPGRGGLRGPDRPAWADGAGGLPAVAPRPA